MPWTDISQPFWFMDGQFWSPSGGTVQYLLIKASDGLTPFYVLREGTKAAEGNCLFAKLISSRLSLCCCFCGAMEAFGASHFPRAAPPGQQNCCRLVPRQDLHFRQWVQREDKLCEITFWICRLLLSCFLLPSVVLSSHKMNKGAPEKTRSLEFEDCGVWWLTQMEGWRACWRLSYERLCFQHYRGKAEVFPVGGLRWFTELPSPGAGGWKSFAWATSGASTRVCCCPSSFSTTKSVTHMLRTL